MLIKKILSVIFFFNLWLHHSIFQNFLVDKKYIFIFIFILSHHSSDLQEKLTFFSPIQLPYFLHIPKSFFVKEYLWKFYWFSCIFYIFYLLIIVFSFHFHIIIFCIIIIIIISLSEYINRFFQHFLLTIVIF